MREKNDQVELVDGMRQKVGPNNHYTPHICCVSVSLPHET